MPFRAANDARAMPVLREALAQVEKPQNIENEAARAFRDEAQASYGSTRTLTFVVIGAAVALGLGLALGLGRLVARPLQRAVTVLEGLAAGDLDQRLDVDTRDEVGQMATALNTAIGTLSDAMRQIGGNAETLAAASEELSATSGHHSGRPSAQTCPGRPKPLRKVRWREPATSSQSRAVNLWNDSTKPSSLSRAFTRHRMLKSQSAFWQIV